MKAVLDNLDTYLVSLNQGVRPLQLFQHSFVHNEQKGVHAIDQSPLKKGFKELQLYVFAEEEPQALHVLTNGDKSQQSGDVNDCAKYVDELRTAGVDDRTQLAKPEIPKVDDKPPSDETNHDR